MFSIPLLFPPLVVCDGQIEPPPLDLEALANWKHNCESEDLPAGSIYISGSMIQDINGVYIPDAEECNENDDVISKMMPVYVKKLYEEDDENEIKLKCVAHDNSYRWQIAFDYGNTVSISKPLAYVEIDTNDISLPGRDTMQRPWQVRVNGSYQEKSEVALRLVQPDLELPDELLKKFSTGHAHIVEMRAKYLTEVRIIACRILWCWLGKIDVVACATLTLTPKLYSYCCSWPGPRSQGH